MFTIFNLNHKLYFVCSMQLINTKKHINVHYNSFVENRYLQSMDYFKLELKLYIKFMKINFYFYSVHPRNNAKI